MYGAKVRSLHYEPTFTFFHFSVSNQALPLVGDREQKCIQMCFERRRWTRDFQSMAADSLQQWTMLCQWSFVSLFVLLQTLYRVAQKVRTLDAFCLYSKPRISGVIKLSAKLHKVSNETFNVSAMNCCFTLNFTRTLCCMLSWLYTPLLPPVSC